MGESLLSLELSEVRGGLSGVIDYNRDVFRASTARRIVAHLEVERPACGARPLTMQAQRRRQWVCHVLYCGRAYAVPPLPALGSWGPPGTARMSGQQAPAARRAGAAGGDGAGRP